MLRSRKRSMTIYTPTSSRCYSLTCGQGKSLIVNTYVQMRCCASSRRYLCGTSECCTLLGRSEANKGDSASGSSIEDSLSVAPRNESSLFSNREKFDLVILYDDSSDSFGSLSTPLSLLVRAIYETEFKKALRNVPVLLAGGLQAWKKELGEPFVARAESNEVVVRPVQAINGYTTPTLPRFNDGYKSPPPMAPRGQVSGRSRAGTETYANGRAAMVPPKEFAHYSLDQMSGSSRSVTGHDPISFLQRVFHRSARDGTDFNGILEPTRHLVRKPTMSCPPSTSSTSSFSRAIPDNVCKSLSLMEKHSADACKF